MSAETNRYGLSRHIPADTALQIRRECGFGCVVCGASIFTYEHIDPEFHDAATHDPAKIALLCASCHGQVTRKFWSKEKIAQARISPKCKMVGHSWGEFEFGYRHPHVRFGGLLFRNCRVPVMIDGTPVFRIEIPEEPGAVFRLSATFSDLDGNISLAVRQNEWVLSSGVWDAEFTGGRIKIRAHDGPYSLILRAEPPDGVAVERLHMRVKDVEFDGNANELRCRRGRQEMVWTGCLADDCEVGLAL